jgi:hypothetical protein
MTSIDEQRQQQQQSPSPTVETLQQKIDEFANGIVGLYSIYRDRRKTIIQQLHEIRQLAKDLSIDDMQLRDMISESCTMMGGVSPSWLRKLLPGYLKSTKHTRKDYLEIQHQRDQQPLQQQQKELVELPTSLSSRHSVSEQQPQPQEEETFTALGYLKLYGNDVPIKVTVNVKTKSIEAMEIAHEIIQKIKHNAKTFQ